MNFSEILKKIFGNKSERDRKLIEPLVEKVKAVHPQIAQLDNDALRERTRQLRKQIKDSASGQEEKIAELKAKIEDTPIDEREEIFNQIDKLEKEVLEIYEGVLNEILPEVFAIVKETAKRFSENEETIVTATDFDRELAADPRKDFITIEGDKAIYHNHWTAGGNDLKWEMVHYDVQLFGGIVLHQGKIAEMATGEGKTLVATLPVFLNALTGNGVHVVTVNDYLAKRDSEWMGPIYEFQGLPEASVATTNSVSTICVTTWPHRLPIWYNDLTTTPLLTRWTPFSSTTHVLRLSFPVRYQKVTCRCLKSISHSLKALSMSSASSRHNTLPRQNRS